MSDRLKLTIQADETEGWLTTDDAGCTHGTGPTPAASLDDWTTAAAEMLSDLSSDDRLSGAMETRRDFLTAHFAAGLPVEEDAT